VRRWLLSAVGILALAGALIGQERAAAPAADTRLDWWREARFGLFIHWGLYAIPAGEWNGRTDYGEWIRNNARIPLATYDTFRDRFNPVKRIAGYPSPRPRA
jgi:alpha-L-fucosidase